MSAAEAVAGMVARELNVIDPPLRLSEVIGPDLASPVPESATSAPPGPTAEQASALHLPRALFDARPVLTHLRQVAHSRGVSADAVFGAALARVAAATPPTIRLPAAVGTAASLNFMVALIGSSGAGKSEALNVAAEVVPLTAESVVDGAPLGSGPGMVEAYFDMVEEDDPNGGAKKVKVKRQTKTSAFFVLDEGQALAQLAQQKGATVMEALRSAWSGNILGQTNATEEKKRRLAAHSYRFAMVAGFQHEHAVPLIRDAAGGTPQRFLFLSAIDPTIPDDPPIWPGTLPWSPPAATGYAGSPVHHTIALPEGVSREIRRSFVRRSRGEEQVAPLDSHRNLLRLKVAGLLAILDDRTAIDDEDWGLAGIVMDTSTNVRDDIARRARAAEAQAEQAGHARAARRVDAVESTQEARAIQGGARSIANLVAKHARTGECPDGCTKRHATHAMSSKQRSNATFDQAVDEAITRGWVVVDGEHYRPGDARPA